MGTRRDPRFSGLGIGCRSGNKTMHIQALPAEILLLVFSHVPVRELLCRVTLVCRQFHDLLQSRWYWSSRYQQLVGGTPTLTHRDEMRLWQLGCTQASFLLGLGRGGRGERLERTLITSAQGGLDCVHLMYPDMSGASVLVAAGSRDSTVYVWRKRMEGGGGGEGGEGEGGRGRRMRSFTGAALRGHRGWVWSVTSEPTRPTLLCSGGWDHTVRMWDVTAGQEIATVTGHHKAAVLCLAFLTPNTLATACYDKTVRAFDIRTPISMTSSYKEHKKPVLSLATCCVCLRGLEDLPGYSRTHFSRLFT